MVRKYFYSEEPNTTLRKWLSGKSVRTKARIGFIANNCLYCISLRLSGYYHYQGRLWFSKRVYDGTDDGRYRPNWTWKIWAFHKSEYNRNYFFEDNRNYYEYTMTDHGSIHSGDDVVERLANCLSVDQQLIVDASADYNIDCALSAIAGESI